MWRPQAVPCTQPRATVTRSRRARSTPPAARTSRSRTLIGVFFLPQQLPLFLNLLRSAPMRTMLHLRPQRPWRPRFNQALMMRLGASGASATFLLQPPSQRLRLLRHRLPPPLGVDLASSSSRPFLPLHHQLFHF